MLDFLFIQLYIRKKYNKSVDEYFDVSKQTICDWHRVNKLPKSRLDFFLEKEGTLIISELFSKIY